MTDWAEVPKDREPVTTGRHPTWPQEPRNTAIDHDKDGYTNLEQLPQEPESFFTGSSKLAT
jgi:hypothetical protein